MVVIATQRLTRRYGPVTALEDLTVEVSSGVTGLVGANGAGKSTLIKLLLGLLPATEGTAQVLDLDVATRGPAIRERVGYMPEHDCLPPDVSATEFVVHMARMSGLPMTAARERAADTLRHVGLYEERYRPMGGYSTGMRQRVKLAQALAHDPDLVLLDEPTNGLDPAGRDDMLELIRRIGAEFGIAVLVTSHLLGELERVCSGIVVIDGGRLLRHSSTASVTAARPVVTVEVDRDLDALAAWLGTAGVRVRVEGRLLHVDVGEETAYDLVRDGVAELELGLVRMERERHRMTEIFTGALPGRLGRPPLQSSREASVADRTVEPTTPGAGAGAGAIHDIGYRHYDGPRLGSAYIRRSLFVDTLRGAYGLGRSTRSKVMPFLLLGVMVLTAVVVGIVTSYVTVLDALPLSYTAFVITMQVAVTVFLGSQSPAVVSRDLRYRTSALYFSRPLSRQQYVQAKYAGMVAALFLLLGLPITLLLAGALLAELPVGEQLGDYVRAMVGAVLHALVLAGIGLVVAAMTPRRGLGVAAVVGVLIVLSGLQGTVRAMAEVFGNDTFSGYTGLLSPYTLVDGVVAGVLGADSSIGRGPPGVVGTSVFVLVTVLVVVGCYALLVARYRRALS